MTAGTTNFLALEPLLVQRLREHVPEVVAILGVADLEASATAAQVTPALHVLLASYEPASTSQGGLEARLRQDWIIVTAVRTARQTDPAAAAREDAGALLTKVFAALMGWAPGFPFTPLKPAAGPRPVYSNGVGYFPLSFQTTLALGGQS